MFAEIDKLKSNFINSELKDIKKCKFSVYYNMVANNSLFSSFLKVFKSHSRVHNLTIFKTLGVIESWILLSLEWFGK